MLILSTSLRIMEEDIIHRPEGPVNDRPVVGIFTQPLATETMEFDSESSEDDGTREYVMAAYVKFVEMGGGIPVPIDSTLPPKKMEKALDKVNGLLFPGGGQKLMNDDGTPGEYLLQGLHAYNYAKKLNDKGTYFPVYAVCMGFQMVHLFEALYDDTLVTGYFDGRDQPSPNNWIMDPRKTYFYSSFDNTLLERMGKEEINY